MIIVRNDLRYITLASLVRALCVENRTFSAAPRDGELRTPACIKKEHNSIGTRVFSFGSSIHGALGLSPPPFSDAYEPEEIPGLPAGILALAAGHYHSLAISQNGQLWSWGRNKECQLGAPLSTLPIVTSPQSFTPPGNSQLASPNSPTLETLSGKGFHFWKPGVVSGLDNVQVVGAAASGVVSMAVGADGSLWAWGTSKRGQLGLGTGVMHAPLPTRVGGELSDLQVLQVSLGWGHALARTSDGGVYSWGYAKDGRLGYLEPQNPSERETEADSQGLSSMVEDSEVFVTRAMEAEKDAALVWEPRRVETLNQHRAVHVACGMDHSLVLSDGGHVYSFGDHSLQQLGRLAPDHPDLPQPIDNHSGMPIHAIGAGLSHSLASTRLPLLHLTADSKAWTWGFNAAMPEPSSCSKLELAEVEGLRGEDLVKLAAGRVHSCALTRQGELLVWGSGSNGRLGLGSTRTELEPCLLDALEGHKILDVACGFDHTLVLME